MDRDVLLGSWVLDECALFKYRECEFVGKEGVGKGGRNEEASIRGITEHS